MIEVSQSAPPPAFLDAKGGRRERNGTGASRRTLRAKQAARPVSVLAVIGSLQRRSGLGVVVRHLTERLHGAGCGIDILDLEEEPLALFNPETASRQAGYPKLQARVDRADIIVLATPDYHGSISGTLKNFLDHFWHEFAGKLFVTIVASHDKGLTVADQLRTVARQCYAWALPYGVGVTPELEVKDGRVHSPALENRLAMLARDAAIYGELLARRRRTDLAGADLCFLARYRKAQRS